MPVSSASEAITLDDVGAALNAPPLAGRYVLRELLGAGGMGEVFRADDLRDGRVVAVKFLLPRHRRDVASHKRFQREIRHLRELHHPAIVAVWDAGEDNDRPFLVMEFVPGQDLRKVLDAAPHQRLTLPRLQAVFLPLLDALTYLHSRGILHRDLKPHNVMVIDQPPQPFAVRLMDFGLARQMEEATPITSTGVVLGTPYYMSPEQAVGRHFDFRADLYSLGVMLYEAAVGRLPFDAPDSMALLFQHVHEPPPAPRRFAPELPPALEALILRLLEKEPQRRYNSAKDVAEVLSALAEAPTDWTPFTVAAPRALLHPPLVGRSAEIQRALELMERAQTGQPNFTAITGESGVGKSRLVNEVMALARGRGARVLQAACPNLRGVALEPVIALLRSARTWTSGAALNPLDAHILAPLLPEVLIQPDAPKLPVLPDAQLERARLYDCLTRHFLAEAASGLLLVVVEDLQWADALTLEWLAYFVRRAAEANASVWVCGSLRSDLAERESALAEFLRTLEHWHRLERVALRPLPPAALAELVAGWLGHPLPALAEYLQHTTQGNPFFAEEVMRALVETGRVRYEDEGWTWDRVQAELPEAVKQLIGQRLERLNADARRTLSHAALIGVEFDFDVLVASLPEASEDQLLDTSDEWVRAQLVHAVSDERFGFTHPLIREVSAAELHGPRLPRAHRRIAEAIEALRAQRLETYYEALVTHYQASKDFPRALDYCLRFGAQTAARSAYAEAARLYDQARQLLEHLPTPPAQLQLSVYEQLGEALERVGNYAEASAAFRQAGNALGMGTTAAVEDWRHAAELSRRMARMLGLQGKFAEAHDTIALARELLPNAASLTHLTDNDLALAARIEIQAATLHYWQGDLVKAESAVTRVTILLRDSVHQRELAEGLNLLGVVQDVSGRLEAAIESYQASLQLWRQLGDEYQTVRTQENLGGALLYVGRWAEAKASDEAGLAYWEKLGDPNQLATARNNLGEVALAQGHLDEAEAHFTFARDTFFALRNPRLQIITLFNLAKVRLEQDSLLSARLSAEAARDLAHETQTDDYLAEGYRILAQIYLAGGEEELALSAAEESLQLARAQELKLDEAAAERVLGGVLMQTGRLADARSHLDHSRALLETMTLPLELGRTWMELARWHAAHGELEQAQHHAAEARRIFSALGAQHDLGKLGRA